MLGQDELLTQNTSGVLDIVEAGDRFGQTLAVNDLNGDGIDDLVIGAPDETISGRRSQGKVHIIFGSATGLTSSGSQEKKSIREESFIRFGRAIALGNLDGDDLVDLVVGVRDSFSGQAPGAGSVEILFGKTVSAPFQFINQDFQGIAFVDLIASPIDAGDDFGAAIAIADFNGDGFDDAAISAPLDLKPTSSNSNFRPGSVSILYRDGATLGTPGSLPTQLIDRDTPGILGRNEHLARFGEQLATGDFDGDGFQDLAISVPRANGTFEVDTGAVQILYGSTNGISTRDQILGQGEATFAGPDVAERGDGVGEAIAAGDFNGDGVTDLAVGAPGENSGAGLVMIYLGNRNTGFVNGDAQVIRQFQLQLGSSEAGDNFGDVLAAGDLNNDGFDDLAISSPGEDFNNKRNSGIAHVIFGSASGLDVSSNRLIDQDDPQVPDTAEDNDRFGQSLAIGNFDGQGNAELVVGVPSEDVTTSSGDKFNAGGVHVIPEEVIQLGDDRLIGGTSLSPQERLEAIQPILAKEPVSPSLEEIQELLNRVSVETPTTPVVLGDNTAEKLIGAAASGILDGKGGRDRINGRGGDDVVLGGAGHDFLIGGTDDDLIYGGRGRDRTRGGAGKDIFVLQPGYGFDLIYDFRNGRDRIGLVKGLAFEDLQFIRRGGSTIVRSEGDKLAVLKGVKPAQLNANDFVAVDFRNFLTTSISIAI